MTKDIPAKSNRKNRRPLIIFIASLLALAIALWIGFAIPANVTTGEENYKGSELKAVQVALDLDTGAYSPAIFASYTKQQVQSVVPITDFIDTDGELVEKCTKDPENVDYYVVTIRRVSLFGSTYGVRDYNNCGIHVYKNL